MAFGQATRQRALASAARALSIAFYGFVARLHDIVWKGARWTASSNSQVGQLKIIHDKDAFQMGAYDVGTTALALEDIKRKGMSRRSLTKMKGMHNR